MSAIRMSRRCLPAALAALLSTIMLAAFTTPAAMAIESNPKDFHPELDWAGSTVAANEGRACDAFSACAARPGAGVPQDTEGRHGAPTGGPGAMATWLDGLDVSGWQGNVDWNAAKAKGAKFAYVKATESTTYRNPYFAQQYNGSYNVGLIRGAYHFALPDRSSGVTQANYFVDNGGGWSRDGRTMPPMLDIEYNPYGSTCYGLSQSAMRSWIWAFSEQVRARTSRYPTVYTTTNWWVTCTGNWAGLGSTNPLFIARYASAPGTLPAGWGFWTIWQYTDNGKFPGDSDYFNGAYDRLIALANG